MSVAARRVQSLLRQRNLTQQELAKGIGRSQSLISQFLAGRRKAKLDDLELMARFLSVPITDLIGTAQLPETLSLTNDEKRFLLQFREADAKIRHSIVTILATVALQPGRKRSRRALVSAVADIALEQSAASKRAASHPDATAALDRLTHRRTFAR